MENFGELLLFSWNVQMPLSGASRNDQADQTKKSVCAQGLPTQCHALSGGQYMILFYTLGQVTFLLAVKLLTAHAGSLGRLYLG